MIRSSELPVRLPYALAVLEAEGRDSEMMITESELLEAIDSFGSLADIAIAEAQAGGSYPVPLFTGGPLSLSRTASDEQIAETVKSLVSAPEFVAAINRTSRPAGSSYLAPGSPLPLSHVPMADRNKTSPVVGGNVRLDDGDNLIGDLPTDLIPAQYRAWLALASFGIRATRKLVARWKANRSS